MTRGIPERVGAGRVAVGGGVRQRADTTRIKNDDDAPGHGSRRFGLNGAPPLAARPPHAKRVGPPKCAPPAAVAFAVLLATLSMIPAAPAEPPPPSPPPSQPPVTIPTGAPSATPQAPTFGAFSLTAQEIDFYSARYILTANGNVEVKLADGARLTGETFAMDVRLNRFVIAGNVKLVAAGATYDGVAFADFFDFDRQYFVPLGDEPDRWTYAHGDYAHPYLGREMPGDTFFLPDVSHDRIFASAQKVVVQPRESIKFDTPTINFGIAKLPWPSYFLNFTANPNFAQNSLPGAFVDGPYDASGGGHSLFTPHIRYDNLNKLFLAAEAHQVSDRHYLVGSISPLTRPFKQYTFDAFDRLSPKVQVQASFQESAFQSDFKTPLSATAFSHVRITAGLPHSYLQLNADQYWDSLLAQPAPGINGLFYYGDPTHNWVPNHPNDAQLSWIGTQNRFVRTVPYFVFSLRSGIGLAHEGYGEQVLGGVVYSTIWNHFAGFNITVPGLDLIPDRANLRRDLYLNMSFDRQRQGYDVPHYVDSTGTNATLSKRLDRHVSMLVGYSVTNTGDYWGPNQSVIYPAITTYQSPFTGQTYPSWAAFDGFQTQRSFVGQLLYTPSTAFATSIQLRHNKDFPEPIPGLAPQPNVLAWQNYGVTPNQLTYELRFRVTPILTIDFLDTYYFNFGGYQKWSPNYQITVLP